MTDTAIQKAPTAPEAFEAALVIGDLSKLSTSDRVTYYRRVCESLGLNPLTRPFDYLLLNNKLTLYARRDCADQLRKIRGITIEVVSRTIEDGILTVHVRATDRDGRKDEDFGAVSVAGLKGEAAANAMLKCITKAKRRVTLSIAGLGLTDETEVESIPGARVIEAEVVAPAAPASVETGGDGHPDFFAVIAAAATQDDLLAVGKQIRSFYGTVVPGAVKEAWKAREAAIKGSGVAA